MNTSTDSLGGAAGGSRCWSRHAVKMNPAMLIRPYVSATMSAIEKTGCSQFSELRHRHTTQYTPYRYATAAMQRIATSCDGGNRGIVYAETTGRGGAAAGTDVES